MAGYDDVITGRDALHRLDTLTARAREEFDAAARGAEGHSRRRADLVRLRSEGYRELAAMRLDVIKNGADQTLDAAEKEATRLLADHAAFMERVGQEVVLAEGALRDAEANRRAGEADVDATLKAYEALVALTEAAVQADPAYIALKQAFEESRAVAIRADGTLASWGRDAELQVTGTPTGGSFIDVAAGFGHSVAIRSDGSLAAWGATGFFRSAGRQAGTTSSMWPRASSTASPCCPTDR